jgi:hypoxia up-regulated 1
MGILSKSSRGRSTLWSSFPASLAVVAIFVCMVSSASANLIGIDLGSTFMKATLVKPGQPFTIVENTASKRKTESMVTIGKDQRSFGADSMLESGKYPLTTFQEVQRMFGQKFDSDFVSKFKEHNFVSN